MAGCWPIDKPLSEPILVRLLTHICVTLLQWVKRWWLCIHQHFPKCALGICIMNISNNPSWDNIRRQAAIDYLYIWTTDRRLSLHIFSKIKNSPQIWHTSLVFHTDFIIQVNFFVGGNIPYFTADERSWHLQFCDLSRQNKIAKLFFIIFSWWDDLIYSVIDREAINEKN